MDLTVEELNQLTTYHADFIQIKRPLTTAEAEAFRAVAETWLRLLRQQYREGRGSEGHTTQVQATIDWVKETALQHGMILDEPDPAPSWRPGSGRG